MFICFIFYMVFSAATCFFLCIKVYFPRWNMEFQKLESEEATRCLLSCSWLVCSSRAGGQNPIKSFLWSEWSQTGCRTSSRFIMERWRSSPPRQTPVYIYIVEELEGKKSAHAIGDDFENLFCFTRVSQREFNSGGSAHLQSRRVAS